MCSNLPCATGALYREVARQLRVTLEPKRGEPRPEELKKSCLDSTRAEKALGWRPSADLQDGIARTIDFFKALRVRI